MLEVDYGPTGTGGTSEQPPEAGKAIGSTQGRVLWWDFLDWLKDKSTGWRAIMVKEWLEIIDDKLTLFIVFAAGCQIFIYGYGISFEVRDVETVVLDQEQRPQSQTVVDQLVATGYFRILKHVTSRSEVIQAIVSGRARVGIIIPPDFSKKIQNGDTGQIQILVDGSDSTVATAVQTASIAVGLKRSFQILSELVSTGTLNLPVEIRPRTLFNPALRTRNFILPGIVAYIAQNVLLLFTIGSIVRERDAGTLEQLMATPVTPLGLLIGKMVPYWLIGFIGTNLLLLVTHFVLHVPMNGDLFLLECCLSVFLFVCLAMGILISCFCYNQVQVVQLCGFVLIPTVMLTDLLVPRETMPMLLKGLSCLLPLTYFIQIQKGIGLRGAGFPELWPWIVPLVALGVILICLSIGRFRRTLG